jgi:DNA modification methylase
MMFWFSMNHYDFTKQFLTSMGWNLNPFPLIWHKSDNAGILVDPNRGPRRTYETCFLATRGDRKIVQAVANSYSGPTSKIVHPSEKPREMLQHFFRMLVDNSTVFLDPTCGSGNAVYIARRLGANTVLGLEKDENFYKAAVDNFDA